MSLGIKLSLGLAMATLFSSSCSNVSAKTTVKEFQILTPSSNNWEEVLSKPQPISLESLQVGTVYSSTAKIINLKGKNAPPIPDRKLALPMLVHLIHHEKFGYFLIDTGFHTLFATQPWGNFQGLLKKKVFKYSLAGAGIDEIISKRKIKLNGVFCTHFHEHQAGAVALPDEIPYVFGKGEKEINYFPVAYTQFFAHKTNQQAIDFTNLTEMPPLGKVVDIFGDGSLWAISTPGHTKGHLSFLINGAGGQYLVMGDLCVSKQSWELGLESGAAYALNLKQNTASFQRIKKFLETHPQIKPIFGHEADAFPIQYQ